MTTVFGMQNSLTDIAILAADRQVTVLNSANKYPSGKYFGGRKIWVSEDENYAFGHAGTLDEPLFELVESLREKDFDIQKMIDTKKLKPLRTLNIARMGTKLPNLESLSSFLFITRLEDTLKLYTCWPLGDVEEREMTWIGSGSPRVNDYIVSLKVLADARSYLDNQQPLTNQDAIRIGLEAVHYAQAGDIYSSGLDMVVLSKNHTKDYFNNLQDNFDRRIKRIQKDTRELLHPKK